MISARLAQRPAGPLPEGAIVKRCSCGRAYTLEEWYSLKRDGLQMYVSDNRACLELRACACGSTISLPMRLTPAPEVEP